MKNKVPHEITLVAFTIVDGLYSVLDIVETSYHNASYFTRKWVRDNDIQEIAACRPGTPAQDWRLYSRTVYH